MGTVTALRPAAHSPIALVRVTGGGRVHRVSVAQIERYQRALVDNPHTRMIARCTTRLSEPTFTIAEAGCAFCSGVTSEPDITEIYLAEACL